MLLLHNIKKFIPRAFSRFHNRGSLDPVHLPSSVPNSFSSQLPTDTINNQNQNIEPKYSAVDRFHQAIPLDNGTHRGFAEFRDVLLNILEDHKDLIFSTDVEHQQIVRSAAERCRWVGPVDKSVELYTALAPLSGKASDFFQLSEVLATQGHELEKSITALERAIALDPRVYDNSANRETLRQARGNLSSKRKLKVRLKMARYPKNEDFRGDLGQLITKHIASGCNESGRFINSKTRFFTMGSCFASNVSKSLVKEGFISHHLDISESVNTTFANKAFVSWLSGMDVDNNITDRFKELLPSTWEREQTLDIISQTDVFILTLGVAPAFFDRNTGEFVLPRSSALNTRVLSESFLFRTTTVEENVDNVMFLINFMRSVSPYIKVVITVSPVPLLATFEFESCVQADCLSKSTMRLVADEIVNRKGLTDVYYWPSFEVFRWAGSNASSFYAADDGAAWHVSEDKVITTVRSFIEVFDAR